MSCQKNYNELVKQNQQLVQENANYKKKRSSRINK